MSEPGEITRLLQEADKGDRSAAEKLYALVEKGLRSIGRKRKRSVPSTGDLSTTMLVDDAFLKLVGGKVMTWQPGDRRKFFGFASRKMHDMLIQAARREQAEKRGGGRKRLIIDDNHQPIATDNAVYNKDVYLDLKDALEKFEKFAMDDALLFRLRFFLDCTFEEMAEISTVSVSDAKSAWQRSRLWLQRELGDYDDA